MKLYLFYVSFVAGIGLGLRTAGLDYKTGVDHCECGEYCSTQAVCGIVPVGVVVTSLMSVRSPANTD